MYLSLLLLLSSSSSFCLVRSLVVVVAVGVLGRALPLVVFAVVLRNALSNSRAKRAGESEREAVQSSLGLLCRSEAALYVSQLLRFGVIRWEVWAVSFDMESPCQLGLTCLTWKFHVKCCFVALNNKNNRIQRFDMELPCHSMRKHFHVKLCTFFQQHLTWNFHVKSVQFRHESFDMELHVKYFHVTHVKLVQAMFDMEIPYQILFCNI